jgi:hypothetical protein
MKKCEQLGHKEPVKSQEGNNHVTFYHFIQASRKQEQHHPRATNRFHSEHKRRVLAITAFIFVPLGLLSPAVIANKIFLQKLWQDKLQ